MVRCIKDGNLKLPNVLSNIKAIKNGCRGCAIIIFFKQYCKTIFNMANVSNNTSTINNALLVLKYTTNRSIILLMCTTNTKIDNKTMYYTQLISNVVLTIADITTNRVSDSNLSKDVLATNIC